jgi:hypothetical protein
MTAGKHIDVDDYLDASISGDLPAALGYRVSTAGDGAMLIGCERHRTIKVDPHCRSVSISTHKRLRANPRRNIFRHVTPLFARERARSRGEAGFDRES